jgi:glycosyltransferase involved in cell wall biosynthesis
VALLSALDQVIPNQTDTPLISVIVALLNAKPTLLQCINSVWTQTYPRKELIIVDGGSSDGSVDILIENDEKIDYWHSDHDKGVYQAWNRGLARARGDWIYFLGADDYLFDEQVLERTVAQLNSVPSNVRVAYGEIMTISPEGSLSFRRGQSWDLLRKGFKRAMCLPHQGVLHRRSLFEVHGTFDESFRILGDYELLLRELKEGQAVFIPGVITAMRQEGLSSSLDNSLTMLREFRRAHRMHGQLLPNPSWLIATLRVRLRLVIWAVFGERLARRVLDVGRRMMGLPAFWTVRAGRAEEPGGLDR